VTVGDWGDIGAHARKVSIAMVPLGSRQSATHPKSDKEVGRSEKPVAASQSNLFATQSITLRTLRQTLADSHPL